MKGGRKLTDWNIFVTKVFDEGRAKDNSYTFKQAMSDASERKSEMKTSTGMGTKSKKVGKKTKKGGKRGKKGTRKNRK